VALIHSPDTPGFIRGQNRLDPAAAQLGVTLVRVEARGAADLPQAFAAITTARADAIFMGDDAALAGSVEIRQQVSAWALARRLPVASSTGSFAADGALLSLGTDIPAIARRAAFQVHRILGGVRPAELPVERPTVFRLTLNRKTATELGLTIPQSLLLRADELIR
jgi:putative ABC transport system substrate-binding protein